GCAPRGAGELTRAAAPPTALRRALARRSAVPSIAAGGDALPGVDAEPQRHAHEAPEAGEPNGRRPARSIGDPGRDHRGKEAADVPAGVTNPRGRTASATAQLDRRGPG